MKLRLDRLSESDGREICHWKREGIYSVYNLPDWETMKKSGFGLTVKEKREEAFMAVVDENNSFSGFVRLREKDGKVIIAVGLKPELCGKGLGSQVMKLLIDECSKRFPNKTITLEVRTFNIRAIKCYKRAGFKEKRIYIRNTLDGEDEYLQMEYKNC